MARSAEPLTPWDPNCSLTGTTVGAKLLKDWLAALDDFRNWLIREAA
jgi:hypothetical protein